MALGDEKRLGIYVVDADAAQRLLHGDDVCHAVEEEPVDAGCRVDLGWRPAATQGAADVDDAVARGACKQGPVALLGLGRAHVAVDAQAGTAVFQRAQRLAKRLLERAADGHDLAHRLHAGGKRVVGVLELLERETRRLHHAIVD